MRPDTVSERHGIHISRPADRFREAHTVPSEVSDNRGQSNALPPLRRLREVAALLSASTLPGERKALHLLDLTPG